MTEPEYYVEIEVPRGDLTEWEIVGPPTGEQQAHDLYNHFLDLGMQVRITTWVLKVVRSTPAHPDAVGRPASVADSIQEVADEAAHHGVKLPIFDDLVKRVEFEVGHLADEGKQLLGELPIHRHPAEISKIPGPEPAAEQPATELWTATANEVMEKPAIPPMPWNANSAAGVLHVAATGGISQDQDHPSQPPTAEDHVIVSAPATVTAAPEGTGSVVSGAGQLTADPAETSVDLMPGDPGYVQYMIQRGVQGTRVSRSQV